jgi:hypothetical protein
MSLNSIVEKFPEINKTIIESSIILISIFATVGLLFGGITQQFKTTYVYFGYMLYYSLPFVVAAFLSTISAVCPNERKAEAGKISFVAVCFFLTGFVMLIFLASVAAQTVVLPSQFVFLMTYQNLSFLEGFAVFVFVVFSYITVCLAERKLSERWRTPCLLVLLMFLIFCVFFMTTYGTNQKSYVADTGSIALSGQPDYKFYSVNVTLISADQIFVEIKSLEGYYFSYAFLDEKNNGLYINTTTRPSAIIIKQDLGSNLSFQTTVESSGTYFLEIKSEYFLGTNITYSIIVYRTDTTNLGNAFLAITIGGSIFLGIMISDTEDNGSALIEQSTTLRTKHHKR